MPKSVIIRCVEPNDWGLRCEHKWWTNLCDDSRAQHIPITEILLEYNAKQLSWNMIKFNSKDDFAMFLLKYS